MMINKALIPTGALLLTGLGGLMFMFCLVPRKWETQRHAHADKGGPLVIEDEIGWGEPVRGLRLGIAIPDSKAYDFNNLLPGQPLQAGLWLENVRGEAIKIDQYCSVTIRAQHGAMGEQLEDLPRGESVKDDPLLHFACLFQDEIKVGERVGIESRFSHEIVKGFLRVGNDRYGPLLAGQYVLSAQAKLTIRTERGAPAEQIELEQIELGSGTVSFGIRDIDWGPARDGVQIALAKYPYCSPERDQPLLIVVCRNCGDKHVQLDTGFDLVHCVAVTKPDGKAASFKGGPRVPGEGSMRFDLRPGEIEVQAHDFRWSDLEESTAGEYAFSASTVFFADKKFSPVYTTNRLKLKHPE